MKQNLKWDGRDIWPLLTGKVTKPLSRTLYWKFVRGASAVRDGSWKLIIPQDGKEPQLYNLATDPYEKQDLAHKYPKRAASLKALLAQYRKDDL